VKRSLWIAVLALAALPCHGAPCSAKAQAEAGRGDEVDVIGAAWDQPIGSECDGAERQLRVLVRIDRWRARGPEPAVKFVWDASVTPYMRWPVAHLAGMPLYADVGIGFHAISHTHINREREMSTAFQFGEFIGAAIQLDGRGDYEFGVRLQHVSNGGIKHPNDGITYPLVTLSRSF